MRVPFLNLIVFIKKRASQVGENTVKKERFILKSVRCTECDEKFSSRRKLAKHFSLAHPDIKNYTCKICDHKFLTQRYLKNHMAFVHERDKQKLHTCEVCNRDYLSKNDLSRHILRVHEKIKPFGCDLCEKTFGDRG